MSDLIAGEATQTRRASSLMQTLVAATLIQIVATASVLALTAIAPTVAADLDIGAYWIGYQISLIYASGMFSSAIAGTLVQRFGPIRIEQAALVCCVIGFAGIATASIPLIVIASLFIGIGYGLNNPASSEMLSRVTPQNKRNIVFSLKQSGVPLGGILASFAFPYLSRYVDWNIALLIGAAAPLLTMGLLAMTHAAEPVVVSKRRSLLRGLIEEQSTIWRSPRLLTLSGLGFAYSAMQLSVSAFAVVTLVHDAGWSLLAAGSVAAAMQFAGAFGRIFWGVVADRIGGGFITLSLLGLLGGAGYALLYWLPGLPPVAQVALFVCMGGVTIGWNGVLLAEVAHNAPEGRVGAITGGALVYTFIGVIVGPSSFASLYALTGHYGASFMVFSLFGFGGMIIAWRAHRSSH
ncbi:MULTISPECIES: MFS transporter [unclassified Rhizobium]|uniref:MFS transporter n=1 Tax=unclassified Rhizobium TaxID=2613769 RepID=UPI001ADC1261|nr:MULTISPECIES: MFS transporter [unclassified Rhizobium]MBO9101635.1 MFS transporter [Rhizobium sp. L58/93]MBO9187628.1 MFS transporter [Rhizobium sp. E27B/91]QXZ86594.1 MFS transporter [Rhizobium sp. K1/93]QXZ93373.1 MFS transporter [Rhizobium sp. K15/93]QYA04793.1 MFS transporter [Rhizobium sp. B21/90]